MKKKAKKKNGEPCSWWKMVCHFCSKGVHSLRVNRNGRIICHFCFVKVKDEYEFIEVENEFYDEDPGTEGEDVDVRSETPNDDVSPGKRKIKRTDRGIKNTDLSERETDGGRETKT